MSQMDDDLDRRLLEEEEGMHDVPEGPPPEAKFEKPILAENFILAGNAIFTIRSLKTGKRFTYKVTKAKPNPQYPGESWFVALLDGPDNTGDYQYLGIIRDSEMVFRLTSKSRYPMSTPSVTAFAWMWDKVIKGRFPKDCEIWHAGRCGRCGRLLTVPESIASGIGPVCAEAGF